tara:strand:+ start:84 stop:1004 length:921 start_codon:yes stop_codon:yes gene_type:complete
MFRDSIISDDGLMIVGLDCNHLPPFFHEEFTHRIARKSHNCFGDEYCDCGIAPYIFAEIDTLRCDCLFCRGYYTKKSAEIATLKSIKEDGCPYCVTNFIYTDIDFEIDGDSSCDICGLYCQSGVNPNFRCPECIHNTDHWINYCEECWNGLCHETKKHSILVEQKYDSVEDIRSSCDFLNVTFDKSTTELFVEQENLMTLFEADKRFFVLNNWCKLAFQMLDYIAHRRYMARRYLTNGHHEGLEDAALDEYVSTREKSFEDFIDFRRQWISVPYDDAVKPSRRTVSEEEMIPKKPILYCFIEPCLP